MELLREPILKPLDAHIFLEVGISDEALGIEPLGVCPELELVDLDQRLVAVKYVYLPHLQSWEKNHRIPPRRNTIQRTTNVQL